MAEPVMGENPLTSFLPTGDVAKLLSYHYDKFPADFQDELRALVKNGEHRTLFTRLEDLIAAHRLDDLLSREEFLRRAMFKLYGQRYPWLADRDMGADAWRQEQERSLAAFKERVERDEAAGVDPYDTAQDEYELELARAHVRKFDIAMPDAAAGVPDVPLAPSSGGTAPRQPFTTGWQSRAPPAGEKVLFDPKTTCEQFFPREERVAPEEADKDDEDEDEDEDDEEGDQDTGGKGKEKEVEDVEMTDAGTDDQDFDPQQVIRSMMTRLGTRRRMTATTTTVQTIPKTATPVGTIQLSDEDFPVMPGMVDWSVGMLRWYLNYVLWHRGLGKEVLSTADVQKIMDESELFNTEGGQPTSQERPGTTAPASGGEQSGTTSAPTTAPTVAAPTGAPAAGGLYDENWLKNWLIRNNAATPDDLKMMSYRGWRIHSPKITLIRIKNFLADEDLDRTLQWKDQYGEIIIYLHYLRKKVYKGQDWGYDLNEAISMIRTHWVYEQHHYGEPELILNFEPVEHPKRLQLPPGAPTILFPDTEESEPVKPRYLQHRIPESVHDVDFQIPGPLLRTRFLTWYREDLTRLWHFDDPEKPLPAGIGSGARGDSFFRYGYNPDFNSAEVADNRYVKCMSLGTAETARTLRKESNFYVSTKDFITTEDGSAYPDGHAVRRFADFRGAKRAALQQCIEHFGTVDDGAAAADPNAAHFRRLVLPTPWRERERIRAEAQKVIVFPPLALKEPPAGEKIDPFGFVYWHDQMLRNHEDRARNAISRTEQGHAERFDAAKVAILPSWNFMGPFRPTLVPRSIDLKWAKVRRFRNMITKVELANRRAPRALLDEILEHFHRGTKAVRPDEDVVAELNRQAKGLPTSENFRPISPEDHHWMDFIAGPSTNDILLEEIDDEPQHWGYKRFAERLQMLLDDPWKEALLAEAGDFKTVAEIRTAINGFAGANPLTEQPYTKEETFSYCHYLGTAGRLAYTDGPGDTLLFARPDLPHHPELRINFYAPPPGVNPLITVRPESELPDPHAPLLDWKAALVAALPLLVEVIDSPGGSRKARVSLAYRTLAYRIGHWTHVLERDVEAAYQALEDEGAAKGFTLSADRYRVQIDDMHGVWRDEVESQWAEVGAAVSYASVARAADTSTRRDASWGEGTYHPEAIEAVRVGLIKELSEGANMLWPVRPRWAGPEGRETMTLARENIWDFGRGRNLKKKQFFSVNRWPLHLQSEATQNKIRASGPRTAPPRKDKDATSQKTENKPATTSGAATTGKDTAGGKGKQLAVRNLGPRLHETLEPTYQFFPGVTEYRKGDTPRQKAAIDQALVDEIRDVLDPEPSEPDPPRRRWWGGWGGPSESPPSDAPDSDPDSDPEAPMFKFPKLKPNEIPASVPPQPPGQRRPPKPPFVEYEPGAPQGLLRLLPPAS